MIVALTLKLRSKEASESQAAQLKQLVQQQDASQKALRHSLDSLSQQMLMQVQENRDTVSKLQDENE